jgi:hypothetical protein
VIRFSDEYQESRICDCAKIQIVFEIANFLGKNFPKATDFDRNRKKDVINPHKSNKKMGL